MSNPRHTSHLAKIRERSAVVGVIGLDYVGLPLAVTAADRGLETIGFDIAPFYLSWKVREYELSSRFMELA